jgi:hypothetical protein
MLNGNFRKSRPVVGTSMSHQESGRTSCVRRLKKRTWIYAELHDFNSFRWIAQLKNSSMLDYGVEKCVISLFLSKKIRC